MVQSSQPQYRVVVEKDVPAQTRDGVTLYADVYRPEADGRFPVLLSRVPYNKNLRQRPGDIDYFVERGYVVIFQDTRGIYASEGEEYYPILRLTELPMSPGRVLEAMWAEGNGNGKA